MNTQPAELQIADLYLIEKMLRERLRDNPSDETARLTEKVRTVRLSAAKAWLND